MKQKTKGALIVTAVFILLIVGLFATVLTYMAMQNITEQSNVGKGLSAYDYAQRGLSEAGYQLVTVGTACNSISISQTEYQVTSSQTSASSTLSSIGSSTLCVNDASSFDASGGVLKVGSEYMGYSSVSGNCFTGLIRGLKGSSVGSPTSGDSVAQNQCHFVSTGATPSISSPQAKSIQEAFYYSGFGGIAWAVGKAKDNILEYNLSSDTWTQYCTGSTCNSLPNREMYGTDCIYDANDVLRCFAVGKNGDAVYYNGTSWSDSNTGTNRDLEGVSCFLDSSDRMRCWAAGERGTVRRYRDYWTSWRNHNSDTDLDDLSDVSCAVRSNGSYRCYVVGEDGFIGQSNRWRSRDSNVDEDLAGVSCQVISNQYRCLAVGKDGVASEYEGSGDDWDGDEHTGISYDLRAVSCVANGSNLECYAISSRRGYYWTGTSWSQVFNDSSSNDDLEDISCDRNDSSNTTYCVVVGEDGRIVFYDGSTWNAYTESAANNRDLYSVSLKLNSSGAYELKLWREE
ncbi:MAG: hypothetical protein ACE365_02660 [Gammaproteobacteria bacterium]